MTTAAPTTPVSTTLAPTTPVPVSIDAGDIVVTVSQWAYISHFPITIPNPSLNNIGYVDPIEVSIEIEGNNQDNRFEDSYVPVSIEIAGSIIPPQYFEDGIITVTVTIPTIGKAVSSNICNWIKWSKIGSLDFEIDESNLAGERPLDWLGCVYKILKLRKQMVAYGQNGVTYITPVDVHYGISTVYPIGIKGLGAAVGDEEEHHFIDIHGSLFSLSDGKLEDLGYDEYFSVMDSPYMFLDHSKDRIYICDGTYGYVYDRKMRSLGIGPANITGIHELSGAYYITTSEGNISIPVFDICTDIYDMGTRKPKTIKIVEISSNVVDDLRLMIYYRLSDQEDFNATPWFFVNPNGITYCPCYGVDFKFRLKSTRLRQVKIDRLKIDGSIHGVGYRDFLSMM